MSSNGLQTFRSFLTERFTAVAVEVFCEVESIVEAYREENRRLQNILHMVLDPEIKLHRIDVKEDVYKYTGEQPSEPNAKLDPEISEPLSKKPKGEQTEYDISWEQQRGLAEADNFTSPQCLKEEQIECDISMEQNLGLAEADRFITSECVKDERINVDINWEQQPGLAEADNFTTLDCVKNGSRKRQPGLAEAHNFTTLDCIKNESKEDNKGSMTCVIDTYHIRVEEANIDSSVDERTENSSSDESETDADFQSDERMSESLKLQKCSEISKRKMKPVCSLQKTMLEFPRLTPMKSFIAAPPEYRSFIDRLNEAFKDFPDDKKPLITKMGLTADVELVDCAFGKVPKGSPLSYQCPVPSSKDYKIIDDAPLQPLLPFSYHKLQPVSIFPTLSVKEQDHLNIIQITWEEAHNLEHSTRGCKEYIEELQKLRLTSRFREICKLKPGRSNAEHLIFKIQKGFPGCKSVQTEEEIKSEAFREYCRYMCVNWYPCGLVVNPNAPWLGAIPDGLVYDPNETSNFGLVHAKCSEFQSFTDCSFLIYRDGVLQLKKNHSYYWHIQGEMMVTGMAWCDLLVFSRKDMLVQRIYRDEVIIKIMKKKLDEFFFYYYLPSQH